MEYQSRNGNVYIYETVPFLFEDKSYLHASSIGMRFFNVNGGDDNESANAC